ncbi:hypothetical protein H072_10274 [Dactylellina haptotyla CBS 200.50]|uniref:Uncharacterized protein n=1 Tax=Dactylellina haptotyla (strain CBS 200.50) TaxID=1284197 RepID=S8A0E7_DACHA|nr:hypothetical protein H072_10274 [Dactylellina haptotyla CBS 200.50]
MLFNCARRAQRVFREVTRHTASTTSIVPNFAPRQSIRRLQTLEQNKNIYAHSTSTSPKSYTLSLLKTTPPNPHLALGTTTTIPPTPASFTENSNFRRILMQVLKEHAVNDQDLINEAYGTWGAAMGVKQVVNKGLRRDRKLHTDSADTPSLASKAEENETVSIGGFHHVVDRRTPYYGGMRIPESHDILGSLEVSGEGKLIGGFVECESYRLVTGDGVMQLTEYLEGKLKERLEEEDKRSRA